MISHNLFFSFFKIQIRFCRNDELNRLGVFESLNPLGISSGITGVAVSWLHKIVSCGLRPYDQGKRVGFNAKWFLVDGQPTLRLLLQARLRRHKICFPYKVVQSVVKVSEITLTYKNS